MNVNGSSPAGRASSSSSPRFSFTNTFIQGVCAVSAYMATTQAQMTSTSDTIDTGENNSTSLNPVTLPLATIFLGGSLIASLGVCFAIRNQLCGCKKKAVSEEYIALKEVTVFVDPCDDVKRKVLIYADRASFTANTGLNGKYYSRYLKGEGVDPSPVKDMLYTDNPCFEPDVYSDSKISYHKLHGKGASVRSVGSRERLICQNPSDSELEVISNPDITAAIASSRKNIATAKLNFSKQNTILNLSSGKNAVNNEQKGASSRRGSLNAKKTINFAYSDEVDCKPFDHCQKGQQRVLPKWFASVNAPVQCGEYALCRLGENFNLGDPNFKDDPKYPRNYPSLSTDLTLCLTGAPDMKCKNFTKKAEALTFISQESPENKFIVTTQELGGHHFAVYHNGTNWVSDDQIYAVQALNCSDSKFIPQTKQSSVWIQVRDTRDLTTLITTQKIQKKLGLDNYQECKKELQDWLCSSLMIPDTI